MAVSKDSNNENTVGTNEQYAGSGNNHQTRAPRTLRELTATHSQKVTFNSGAPEEELSKIHESANQAIQKSLSANSDSLEVGTALITSETGLALPVLAIYYIKDNTLNYYTVMFYKWMNKSVLPNPYENIGGREIENDLSPTKIFNRKLNDIVTAAIVAKADSKVANARTVGYVLVNEDVDLQDEEVSNAYVETAIIALRSANGVISPWNAEIINGAAAILENSVEIAPGSTSLDVTGQPVPHDFATHLDIIDPKEQGNESIHNDSSTVRLATAKGLIDFVYTPPKNKPRFMTPQINQIQEPHYTAHMVITETGNLASDVRVTNEDLLSQLLSVASLGNLAVGSNFIEVLNRVTPNKASVGALGFEFDPETGTRPAKPAAIKIAQAHHGINSNQPTAYNMADTFFSSRHLITSMDLKIGGRLEWVQGTLHRAANGDTSANAAIIACLNEFTGGQFGKVWGDRAVMAHGPSYITDGVYYGEKSEVRNVRDFDYLRMAEVSKGDVALMETYSHAHTPGYNDKVVMHEYREKVLKNVLSGFKPQGIIARVTFANGFVDAILRSISAAGLRIQMNGNVANSNNGTKVDYDPSSFETAQAPSGLYSYQSTNVHSMPYEQQGFAQSTYNFR